MDQQRLQDDTCHTLRSSAAEQAPAYFRAQVLVQVKYRQARRSW